MNKIIIALAFICLVLPGCQNKEVEYNKYRDVEFLFNCDKLNTLQKRCDCLGGSVLKLKAPHGFDVFCIVDDDYMDIKDDPQLNT